MATRPRRRRPSPERSGPVRNPIAPGPPPPPLDALLDATVGEGWRVAERLAETSTAAVQDAVECGVRTAYTVIDEYMTRGREAARQRSERPFGGTDMNDDRQQYGNWSAAWGPMWPLMAPWVQAMRAWTTAMSGFTPGAIPPEWSPHGAGAAWGPGSSQTTASVQVSVQVSSSTPTEVVVTTAPGVEALPLVADALAIDDGVGAPPLVGVTLAGAPGRLRVCVTVPEDQPVGRYSGAIRNAAGVKVGDLTVIVTAPGGVSHASAGVSQG